MRARVALFTIMLTVPQISVTAGIPESQYLGAAQFNHLFRPKREKERGTAPASSAVPRAPITSVMGMRYHPVLGRKRYHSGVDIAVPAGTPIRATADGQVAHAGEAGGYGFLVILRHPSGYETRFAHMARIAVKRGQNVRRGEVLGFVGSTGLSTGPHLHYEVRRAGAPLSPLAFMNE